MAFQSIQITQISHTGLRIETSFPLHLDALHEFRLSLAGFTLIVKGRVVHCRVSEIEDQGLTYLAGVELTDLSEHARLVIETYLNEHRSTRADDP